MSTHIVTHVYFDGGCPVCRREIGWYQSRPSRTPIEWVDVSAGSCDPATDLCRSDALRVFHVRCADGRLVRGRTHLRCSGSATRALVWPVGWPPYPGRATRWMLPTPFS